MDIIKASHTSRYLLRMQLEEAVQKSATTAKAAKKASKAATARADTLPEGLLTPTAPTIATIPSTAGSLSEDSRTTSAKGLRTDGAQIIRGGSYNSRTLDISKIARVLYRASEHCCQGERQNYV